MITNNYKFIQPTERKEVNTDIQKRGWYNSLYTLTCKHFDTHTRTNSLPLHQTI